MASQRRRSSSRPIAQKYWDIFGTLCLLDIAQRKALLRKADSRLVTHICECALNILRGNVPLSSKSCKKRLRQHAPLLRKLPKPGSLTVRKKLLIKSADILPIILKSVLSVWNTQGK